jgi:hypothetical protein
MRSAVFRCGGEFRKSLERIWKKSPEAFLDYLRTTFQIHQATTPVEVCRYKESIGIYWVEYYRG